MRRVIIIFQKQRDMESYRDLPISEQLLERVPALTVGYSPHFDDLVNFVKAEPITNALTVHNDLIPYFLRKFEVYDSPTLASWATETPIDQAITCLFARCLTPRKGVKPARNLPESEIMERFAFCVTKINCLDYLDFIIRVLHVINDKAIEFEICAWADWEEGAALASNMDAEEWYAKKYLPKVLTGHTLNQALDGAASLIKRYGQMMELLGGQYQRVVTDVINLRPQHVAGCYFVAKHVTQ